MRLTLPLKLFVTQTNSLAGEDADRLVPHADRAAALVAEARSMRLTLSLSPLATQRKRVAEREALGPGADRERSS